MRKVPRREFLTTSALLSLTTGCLSSHPSSSDTTPATATRTEQKYTNRTTTAETSKLQNKHAPPIRTTESVQSDEWTDAEWIVSSDADQEKLTYTSGTDGLDASKEFLSQTNYATDSVVVHQYTIENRFTYELQQVKWSASSPNPGADIKVLYDRNKQSGPGKTTGEQTVETTLIRLPDDVTQINYFAYGTTD